MVQNNTRKKGRLRINKRKKTKQKSNNKKHVWLSGRLHIEGRLNEGPRLQRKHKVENEAKQKQREIRHDIHVSANQTPGGHKFAPLVAISQQGRANQHESACFGLSSSWSFLSRSGIRMPAVVQPWLPGGLNK